MLTVVTAPETNNLTTIDDAQLQLGLDDADLTGVPDLITAASEMCAQWANRLDDNRRSGFCAQTVRQTERLDCAADCILLDRDLNPAITSVVEDGTTLSASDYELDGALLYRLDDDERTTWPAAKIVITYTTGWTRGAGLPWPIEQAALRTLAMLIAGRGENPMEKRYDNSLVTVAYRDTDGGIPPDAAQLLAPWRRIWL